MRSFYATMRTRFETTLFGVCSYLGRKMNIPGKYVRLSFIYVSFLTFGSPIILYLIVAFWLKVKNTINGRRNPVWDL